VNVRWPPTARAGRSDRCCESGEVAAALRPADQVAQERRVPAVAFALTRHFPWARAAGYWLAQLAGAVAAAALVRGSLGNVAHVGATLPSGSQGQSFLWELVMSAFLMFVILAVATDTRAVGEAAAIAIGGTIGLDAMFGGPISGASMNPMRSLGPVVVSGDLHALAVPRGPGRRDLGGRTVLPVRARRADPAGRGQLSRSIECQRPAMALAQTPTSSGCEASVNSRNWPVTRYAVCSPMSTAWSPIRSRQRETISIRMPHSRFSRARSSTV
jgi:hypothetical protein